jgi:hypothetical protein
MIHFGQNHDKIKVAFDIPRIKYFWTAAAFSRSKECLIMTNQTSMLFRSVQLQMQSAGSASVVEEIKAAITVQSTGLLIEDLSGHSRFLDFNDVLAIQPAAYQLDIQLLDTSRFHFSQLGHDFDPFVYQVYLFWNDFVSAAMYIDEDCLIEVKGDYAYDAPARPLFNQPACHEADQHGDNRFRLYDSSLMILPVRGPVRRVPLCFVQDIKQEKWQIAILTEHGEQVKLIRLGYDSEAMFNAINQAVQRQTARASSLLQQVLGLLEPASLGTDLRPLPEPGLLAAAWYLREGRAADWQTLNQVCPGLTDWLDRLLRQWSSDGYYLELVKLAADSGAGNLAIGIRREQGTDTLNASADEQNEDTLSEDTLSEDRLPQDQPEIPAFWLAVPAAGMRPAILVEVIAGKPLAQATYVFDRDPDPAAWPLYRQVLNRGLEAVDFRRQPIYFPLKTLSRPAFINDLSALRFCPPLQFLRSSYRGRLIHRDLTSWRSALDRLLQ